MGEPFTIDIWSDVICPYCYLGKRQLEVALAQFEHVEDVVIAFRAFELDVNARSNYDRPLEELVARKYRTSVERVAASHRQLESEAAAFGLTWNLDDARATNTFDAHRLIALAKEQGRGAATADRLFRAYFCDGELVSDHRVLERIGTELALEGVHEMLTSDQMASEVRADEEAALELGFSGVPAMLLDGRFVVSGAQGADVLLDVLRRAWRRRESI